MFNLAIERSQLVEAKIVGNPSKSRRYQFTEIPNLSRNNIILYGIEGYTADQLSKTVLGETVIAAAATPKISLTLKDNANDEFMYQMPFFNTIRSLNGGFVMIIKPRIINLTDCFIQLSDPAGINANEVIPFNFYYRLTASQNDPRSRIG